LFWEKSTAGWWLISRTNRLINWWSIGWWRDVWGG
jgi:hypothetical protein